MGSSFLFSHLGQVQMQFAFFLPLTLLLVKNYFSKGNFGYALLLGINIVAAFFTAAYYGIFSTLLAGVWTAFVLNKTNFNRLFKLALGCAPSIIFLFIATKPYRLVRQSFGGRNLANIKQFSGSPWSYFSSPEYNLLWGNLTSGFSHYEAHLFTGLSSKILLLIGFVYLLKGLKPGVLKLLLVLLPIVHLAAFAYKRNLIPGNLDLYVYLSCLPLWIIIGLFFILSKGENKFKFATSFCGAIAVFYFASLGIVGAPKADALSIDLNTFLRIIPGFDAIRATSRYGIVTNLFELIFAAIILTKISSNLGKRASLIVPGLFCVVSLFESQINHFPRFQTKPRPQIFSNLEKQAPGAAVVLPFLHHQVDGEEFSRHQTRVMAWVSNRRIVNGYSGMIPQFTGELGKKLKNFPSQASVNYLKQLVGLKYIVFLAEDGFKQEEFNIKLSSLSQELKTIVSDSAGNTLFELNPVYSGKKTTLLLESKAIQNLNCKVRSLESLSNLKISQSFDGKLKKIGGRSIAETPSRFNMTIEKPFKQNRPVKLVFTSDSEFELSQCSSN